MAKTKLNERYHFTGNQFIPIFRAKNNELRLMLKKVKNILLLVLSILCTSNIVAFAKNGDAGQPGEFLRYGVGGRALGMGHTFTGLADDASTVYWNPAGLMNVERMGLTSMYTNLFVDSRYTFMSVALPRTFVGPHNAVGFGWVNLNMADFDQRDSNNMPKGNFDFYEQAFLISGAREFVSSWGILNYGLNLKIINQAFPGYVSEHGATQGWGFGADLGATFRPINAPLFNLIPLRYIMPLQLGIALQNILPPQIGIGDGEKDKYPFIFRWGASYSLPVKNWRFALLYDQEFFSGRGMGNFMGVEADAPAPFAGTHPSLRAGWNSRTGAPSIGGGLELDYINNAAIHIDFAYTLKPHEALDNDFRLFLSVDFGQSYDTSYFTAQIDKEVKDRQKMTGHLQILTHYQEDYEAARASALILAGVYDEANDGRYLEFIGGKEAMEWLFQKILELSSKYSYDPNVVEKLQKLAGKIITIFESEE